MRAPGHQQADLRVALAERTEASELGGDLVAEALAADDRVDASVRAAGPVPRTVAACAQNAARNRSSSSRSISRPAAAR